MPKSNKQLLFTGGGSESDIPFTVTNKVTWRWRHGRSCSENSYRHWTKLNITLKQDTVASPRIKRRCGDAITHIVIIKKITLCYNSSCYAFHRAFIVHIPLRHTEVSGDFFKLIKTTKARNKSYA